MTRILGIDPSRQTGIALVEIIGDRIRLVDSACVAGKTAADAHPLICRSLRSDWLEVYDDTLHAIAIEEPPHLRGYAHWSQHRLAGRIEQLCADVCPGVPVHMLSPKSGKAAVGVKGNSRTKPTAEVEALLGHELSDVKYVREAVADAVAIALAAQAARLAA